MGDISFIAVHAFVKPATYGALYVELASRAYVSAAASGLSKIKVVPSLSARQKGILANVVARRAPRCGKDG